MKAYQVQGWNEVLLSMTNTKLPLLIIAKFTHKHGDRIWLHLKVFTSGGRMQKLNYTRFGIFWEHVIIFLDSSKILILF